MRKDNESSSETVGAGRPQSDERNSSDRADRYKLPTAKSTRRKNEGNRWLEVDREEKIKAVATVAVVLAVLGVGLWVLFHGMSH